tara:strand:+ start:575 stop:1282 length:708 start_codon:yes stop_codon:yes gene_type:complete
MLVVLLHVENLNKSFSGKTILKNLNFSIPEGEIVGFLGPNGAGKTTTLRILSGLLSPDRGKVFFEKKEYTKYDHSIKKNIGYLPERLPLYSNMTPLEQISLAIKLHKVKDVELEIKRIIELTQIEKVKNRLNKFLSRGFRQRVGLGLALVSNPKIVFLDEPTTGLDPKQIVNFEKTIKEISNSGTSFVISSHRLEIIQQLCSKALILYAGEIKFDSKIQNKNLRKVYLETTSSKK